MEDDLIMTEFNKNLKSKDTWLRGLFMAIYAVLWGIAEVLLFAVALIQFFTVLLTGKKNPSLLMFGQKVSDYFHAVAEYVTFNRDDKPFPFNTSGSTHSRHLTSD